MKRSHMLLLVWTAGLAISASTGTAIAASDRDGDCISDSWQVNGVDTDRDGTVDLNLPALGASPDHPDTFVELDSMEHHQLDQNSIRMVQDAFVMVTQPTPTWRTPSTAILSSARSDPTMTGVTSSTEVG